MSTIALVKPEEVDSENPKVGDLKMSNHQFVWIGRNEKTDKSDQFEILKHRLETSLSLIRGEWYQDQKKGLPVLERLTQKGITENTIRSIYKSAIMLVPGIADVKIDSVSISSTERSASLEFTAIADNGQAIKVSDFAIPFVIDFRRL